MLRATDLSVGATVLTADDRELGTIKEVATQAFKIDASMKPDYWLNIHTVMGVEDGSVRIGVEGDHLGEFSAGSSEEADSLDAIQLLIEMHGEQKAYFKKILGAQGAEAGRLWDDLIPILKVHEEMEDQFVYGPLEAELNDGPLADYDDEHQSQVDEVEGMIERTRSMAPGSDEWRGLIEQIKSTLEEHISEEESEIFPAVNDAWTEETLADTGKRMLEFKERRLS